MVGAAEWAYRKNGCSSLVRFLAMRIPKSIENRSNIKCLQCSLRIVLHSLLHKEFSEEKVDVGTQYDSRLWTWTPVGGLFLKQNLPGFSVEVFSQGFNYLQFAKDGEAYLLKCWAPQRMASQRPYASSHFLKEAKLTTAAIGGGVLFKNNASPQDITGLLSDRLVIAQVDPVRIYCPYKVSQNSHYVVLAGRMGGDILVLDPGMPAKTVLIPENNYIQASLGDAISIAKPQWWNNTVANKDLCPCGSKKIYKRCGGYYFKNGYAA